MAITRKQIVAGEAFPIGSVFMCALATNPNTVLGYGVWSSFSSGRFTIGRDAVDPDFDTALEAGGSKTANHPHSAGALATDQHAGLVIEAHVAHPHPLSSPSVNISIHQDTSVADHDLAGDLSHVHSAGTLEASTHKDAQYAADHQSALFQHQHACVPLPAGSMLEITAAHGGASVNNHPGHQHQYSQSLAHTHILAYGWGSHRHHQTDMSSSTGIGSGPVRDSSASGPTSTDVNSLYSSISSSAAVPEPPSSGPTGVSDYATPPSYTHTTNQASGHDTHNYAKGSPSLTEATESSKYDLVHTIQSQLADHVISSTTGTGYPFEDPIVHTTTQPTPHTLTGTTDNDSGRSHNITAVDSAHTFYNSTGSTAINTVPPYAVIYMWQRVS